MKCIGKVLVIGLFKDVLLGIGYKKVGLLQLYYNHKRRET